MADRDEVKVHALKTDSEVFKAVENGSKTHEIRYNDRDFKVGDHLLLRETVHAGEGMKAGAPLFFTGANILKTVSHVLTGYGLKDGWVILSFAASTPPAEQVADSGEARLPEITEDERQWLHYNPNTNDLVEFVQSYAKRAVIAALAAQPAAEPVAWLYTCQRPGKSEQFASVSENDTSYWPIDQWTKVTKEPLGRITAQAQPAAGQVAMTDYEAMEREHMGDADKRTGIYHHDVIAGSDEGLHTFLNAAAGEGFILDGVDAGDLYKRLFPQRYADAVAATGSGK